MNSPFFRKKVLVVGAGISGVSVANLLSMRGAFVKLTTLDFDHHRWEGDLCSFLDRRIDVEMGRHTIEFARGSQIVVLSPGVRRTNPIVQWALENAIQVMSEIEVAYFFARSPIIAITGTNGKSTTVELLARILRRKGFEIALGGNLDIPFSMLVLSEGHVDYYLLEVSSFQLEWISEFCPWIGVIMNIAPNHLDHHVSYQEYVGAKFKLFNRQTLKDHAIIMDTVNTAFSERVDAIPGHKAVINTLWDNQDTVFLKDGWIWGNYPQLSNARRIIPVSEIALPGEHNIKNVMVASAAAVLCSVQPDVIREAVRGFRGLAHRIEEVRVYNGVKYVNDSKSTSPDATRVALASCKGKVVLLMGGLEKSYDFATLRSVVADRVKVLVTFGNAAKMIYDVFSQTVRVIKVASMQEAVEVACRHAVEGETVLLSPACASVDMFSSYKHRGEVFRRAVNALPGRPAETEQNVRSGACKASSERSGA